MPDWDDEPLSATPQVRLSLLDVTADRGTAEVALIVLPALLAWYCHALSGMPDLVPWAVGMALLAPVMHLSRRLYRRDRRAAEADQMVGRWEPRLTVSAGLYGLAWSLPPLLILENSSLVFSLIFYMVLQGVCIGATAHLSAVFPAFVALMAGVWVPALVAVPVFFPGQWMYLLPMFALFTAVITRHAWGMYRFMLRQLVAEERGQELARRYKDAKEAAEAALLDRGLFLATASHDLRQPVHAMSLLVEAVSRRNSDATIEPMLSDLRHSMESMSLMFGSLLDLSRLDTGRVTPSPVVVRLSALLAEIEALFREQASRRGLHLRVHRPPPHARVFADPLLMRQALVNLVHNSLRYTERGGLLLGVRRRGALWQVEVWDSGVGIADGDSTRIFSPFFRDERARRIDSAGHGLGLAVVARCAQLMGAELGFRSRLGTGSRFWLRWPALLDGPPMAAGERRAGGPAVAASATQPALAGRCLVVDDDPQVRIAWHALLGSWGVHARGVGSAAEARAVLDEGFAPQAIFCDQRLHSGESGFDLLRELLGRCPGASGAMVSGEFGSPQLQEAEAEGYIVLHKPVNPDDLRALLSTWFDHRMSPSI
jgi:signal transduction histidine kinase/CheY-like chemotaxis protein